MIVPSFLLTSTAQVIAQVISGMEAALGKPLYAAQLERLLCDVIAYREVLDETASAPGRFRLYRTTTGRDADLARSVEAQEPNTVGLLLEDVFTASRLSVAEDPAPCSSGSDGLCAWSWSGDLGSTVTLTILVKES